MDLGSTVAVGRKGGSAHAMAEGAGGSFRLGHPMQGLAVVDGLPRLGKEFGVANSAVAVDPLIVQLVGKGGFAIFVIENDGLGRGDVGPQRRLRGFHGSGFGSWRRLPGRGGDHEPNCCAKSADKDDTENNLKGTHSP